MALPNFNFVNILLQSTHFEVLEACAVKAGIFDPEKIRMDHMSFGVVLGEDRKKFKTRSGETVKLSALLDEGKDNRVQKVKLEFQGASLSYSFC